MALTMCLCASTDNTTMRQKKWFRNNDTCESFHVFGKLFSPLPVTVVFVKAVDDVIGSGYSVFFSLQASYKVLSSVGFPSR